MFGFAIRVVIFVFLEPASEVWNQKRVKFVPMCEPEAVREKIMCLGSQFGSCSPYFYNQAPKFEMFGFAIRIVISVFRTPGSEVWNPKRVKFVSMCEADAIREGIMRLGPQFGS